MAFKSLKNHIGSLASSVTGGLAGSIAGGIAGKAASFLNGGKQKDAGKVHAQLLKKSPFDIPSSPSQKLRENPLSFSSVQYPIDLGSQELGHFILFEMGFITYQPQQDSAFESSHGHLSQEDEKITGKVPGGSITNGAIAIYMPPGIKVDYGQSYDGDTETGLSGDVQDSITAARSAKSTADSIIGAMRSLSGSVLRKTGQFVGETISLAGMGDPVRFTLKRFGTAINPRNEAFYNTPNQRSFSYTFDFWPRSSEEALAVEQIITMFKYNSAPGLVEGDGVFVNPNYYKISYMYHNNKNKHLHEIGACFCTDVAVDYSPDGQFTTFENGMPVHTKLTVSFIEDRIITKRDIEAGA